MHAYLGPHTRWARQLHLQGMSHVSVVSDDSCKSLHVHCLLQGKLFQKRRITFRGMLQSGWNVFKVPAKMLTGRDSDV